MAKKAKKPAKAGKAKNGAAKAKPDAAVKAKAGDVAKMPGDGTIKSAASELDDFLSEANAAGTDMREMLAGYKKKGIHLAALKAVQSEKRAILKSDRGAKATATKILHMDHYREVLGVNQLLRNQGEMFARTELKSRGEGEERDLRPDNLRQPDASTPPSNFSGTTSSLVNPKHLPTKEQVEDIAERAGAKPH